MKKNVISLFIFSLLFMVGMNRVCADEFYSVEFYPNNGENTTTQLVESGKTVNPINPVREGYELENWILVSTNEVYDFNTPVTSDIQLKAKWKLINTTDDITNPDTGIVSYIVIAAFLMLASFGVMTYMICKRSA